MNAKLFLANVADFDAERWKFVLPDGNFATIILQQSGFLMEEFTYFSDSSCVVIQ